MGVLDSIVKSVSGSSGVGFGSLKNASDPGKTSNDVGVYILIMNDDIKKAGSAEIGIQKRMQQYYGLNTVCGLNKFINESNRDDISVKWQYCNRNQCAELESKLNDKYEKQCSMEWSERRPRSRENTVKLII